MDEEGTLEVPVTCGGCAELAGAIEYMLVMLKGGKKGVQVNPAEYARLIAVVDAIREGRVDDLRTE